MTTVPSLLTKHGRKVGWFCDQMGISRAYYYAMESGRRPLQPDYLVRASAVLGEVVTLVSTSCNASSTSLAVAA